MSDITLYVDGYYISPYALSAYIALEEAGVEFKTEKVRIQDNAQKNAGYHARTGRVPALKHGDFWLAESSAICEYVSDVFSKGDSARIFPADPKERAVCREVQAWVRSSLMPIREERPTSTVWFEHTKTPLSAAGEAAAATLIKVADGLVAEGRATIFASGWCIADTDLAMMLQRLHANADPLPPKLAAYAEAQWARPSVAKWNAIERGPFVPY